MPKQANMQKASGHGAWARALGITSFYFVFGSLWIVLTELAVVHSLGEFTAVSVINIAKGMLYVVLTSCLILALVHMGFRQLLNTNRQLEKSESILLDAQRLTHIGSYEYDALTKHFNCTDEMLLIMGIAPETFDGNAQMLLERLHEEDRIVFPPMGTGKDIGDIEVEQICHITRPDGDERLVSVRAVRSFGPSGQLLRSSGTLQDITERYRVEAAIKQERDQAERYLDIAASVFMIVDTNGVITLINRSGCEALGLPREQVQGRRWTENFIAVQDRQSTSAVIEAILAGEDGERTLHECTLVTADGVMRNFVWRSVALTDEKGKVSGILTSGVDVTELKTALDHLWESERSKAVMLSNLPGMAFRCSVDRLGVMQFVSDGCYPLTGHQTDAFEGAEAIAFDSLICEEYRAPLLEATAEALASRTPLKYEYEILTASGERKWVLENSRGVYGVTGAPEALEGIVIDITESKLRFLQIQYMNDHDALTGLYNRLYFEAAKADLDRGDNHPLSIVLTDINGLKLVNEAFGTISGDQMIRKAATILRECCGPNDVLARTGGDEFSILSPHAGHVEAANLIAAVRTAFEHYNASLEDKTRIINLSLAFSVKETTDTGIAEATKQAEDSLSRQKLLDKRSHHNAMLATIMATMYERSFETEEHAERIARISVRIGGRMKLSQRQLDELHLFAMLHDIGKIGIHDQILKKPAKLTDDEWSEMRKHPEIGYRIAMSTPELATVADYILTHHEKWDGTGYPRGMRGEEIPLLSRILAVADAYDAMTEDRVYRKGMPKADAMAEILRNSGTQFDPSIVDVFMNIMTEDDTLV